VSGSGSFTDAVGQRRRDRRPDDQHEQREVLHVAHPVLLIFKLCLIVQSVGGDGLVSPQPAPWPDPEELAEAVTPSGL
jgi:hypothetical protein